MNLALLGFGRRRFWGRFLLLRLALLAFAFWIWMLVSALQNQGLSRGGKVGWVAAIVLLPFIGSCLYLLIIHSRSNSPNPA